MTLIHGDCLQKLKEFESDHFDAIITDPPAGISFMGKAWDGDKGGRKQWIAWMSEVMQECLRVLKPGAHGLVWALPRTSHWTATALEDAGFEIRDVVNHIFGSGFPKSLDVSKAIDKAAGAERPVLSTIKKTPSYRNEDTKTNSSNWDYGTSKLTYDAPITAPLTLEAKQWEGWGTALKPAHEHWILVRKPLSEKTVAKNVLKHGTGALNIDASRIATENKEIRITNQNKTIYGGNSLLKSQTVQTTSRDGNPTGRFPANLILSEESAKELDEHSGQLSQCGGPKKTTHDSGMFGIGTPGKIFRENDRGASRFFYVAKASKSDKSAENTHPTVKSTKLMEYLIKLITPPNGKVLDPFMGSGSTGVAAVRFGYEFLGIEQSEEYFKIAEQRVI